AAGVEISCRVITTTREDPKTACTAGRNIQSACSGREQARSRISSETQRRRSYVALRQRNSALGSVVSIDVNDQMCIVKRVYVYRAADAGWYDRGVGDHDTLIVVQS